MPGPESTFAGTGDVVPWPNLWPQRQRPRRSGGGVVSGRTGQSITSPHGSVRYEPVPKVNVGYGPQVAEHVDTMFVSSDTVPVPGVENEPVAVMMAPDGRVIWSVGDPDTNGSPAV